MAKIPGAGRQIEPPVTQLKVTARSAMPPHLWNYCFLAFKPRYHGKARGLSPHLVLSPRYPWIAGRQDLLELVIDVAKDRVGALQWFDYWTERLDRLCAGAELDEGTPVEFGDALIAGP
jgi:hypothetical protein